MKLLSMLLGVLPISGAPPAPAAAAAQLTPAARIPEQPAARAADVPRPSVAVLDQMVRAFQAGLVMHGWERAAMGDALLALRWADLRADDFTGPGKRRASAKAQRRFRAFLDRLILDGAQDGLGWRDPDGRPFA